jgi:hypothetical protein
MGVFSMGNSQLWTLKTKKKNTHTQQWTPKLEQLTMNTLLRPKAEEKEKSEKKKTDGPINIHIYTRKADNPYGNVSC